MLQILALTSLLCQVSLNSEPVIETKVTLNQEERQKAFGEFEGLRFFLSQKKDVIELEIYDGSGPSRSYSSSKLTEKGSFVELAIWKREYLLEARCTLL